MYLASQAYGFTIFEYYEEKGAYRIILQSSPSVVFVLVKVKTLLPCKLVEKMYKPNTGVFGWECLPMLSS